MSHAERRQFRPIETCLRALPGLCVAVALATLGVAVWMAAAQRPMVSPMIVALVCGVVLGNVGPSKTVLSAGTAIAMRPVLRTGIVLLGFRLTLGDLGQLGFTGFVMVALLVVATFFVILRAGRVLGVSPQLSELIAAGTSICGASAVLGMNTLTRARDEEVAYAIACVTIFGTVSMVTYPILLPLFGTGEHAFGLWAGATIHEVAQAVGAGWSVGEVSGETATITKLSRVLMLAPMIISVGVLRRGHGAMGGKLPLPLFVFGFLGAIIVNTVAPIPAQMTEILTLASTFMLAMALGAMGLETRLAALRAERLRPLILGCIGWLFISMMGAVVFITLGPFL